VKAAFALLRHERKARLFFLALAQSSLGTGAAYVGLLLIAYERFRSPWAISLVLLADFLPSMLLGPLVGAAADRWSRRWCLVVADVIRALAFVGIAFVDSFLATVAFALAAGFGTALFKPAALAGLPALVAPERRAAATSLYSAVTDLGWTLGPAIAAAALLIGSAEGITAVNGITFAASALIIMRLPLDQGTSHERSAEGLPVRRSLFREGIVGWRSVAAMLDIRIVILAATGAMFFGGLFNVGELLFATETLGAGDSGYSLLVALYGLGFVVGSLSGSGATAVPLMRRRFAQGLALTAAGSLGTAVAPSLGIALVAFAVGGFGNGVLVVHERLLIQERVPDELQGRAFGLTDTLVSWAFAIALLSAGAIAELTGPRGLLLAAAAGEIVVAAAAFGAMRQWLGAQRGSAAVPAGGDY
jgi:MFS family permease